MTFAPGSRLGPYEIVGKIGAGGMGEVFRARDTRLDREVAIKVLPEAFGRDADRVARFEREAKAVAALSHPNVLAIFDTGRHSGQSAEPVLYVVTEFLEGETLRDRLAQGALSVRRSIDYGVQIARGLAAAHDKGLVHRDLKPENVFLVADGQVKILDFGLARPVTASSGSGATQTVANITDPGMVMGTVGYMAPEQVRGQPVDGRCDVFAFGAVLYEMLTGTRAFARETAAETMTAILKEDPPDLTGAHPEISPALDRIIRHCLEKNVAERFQSARDAAFALESLSASGATSVAPGPDTRRGRARGGRIAAALAALAVVAAASWAAGYFGSARPGPDSSPVTRLDIVLPAGDTFAPTGMVSLSLSPDGRTLYYVASRNGIEQVFRRRLDSIDAEAVKGTEGATHVVALPDGEWLAYATNMPSTVRKLPVAGGPSVPIAKPVSVALGIAESTDGRVMFGTHSSDLYRTTAGGEPETLVKISDLGPPRFPVVLPDGRGLLFTIGGAPVANRIAVLPTGETTPRVLTSGTDATYVATGHMVFWREGALWAVPFDAARLAMTGDAVPVVEQVAVRGTGRAAFAVAPNGTLAYVKAVPSPKRTLLWVDRQGRETPLNATPGPYTEARLSPDNRRVLLTYRTDATEDIWMHDIARGVTEPFVAEPVSEWSANWTADGERVLFSSRREGPFRLYTKRANGLGGIEATGPAGGVSAVFGPTPDGQGILVSVTKGVSVVTLATNTDTVLWTEPAVGDAFISPDGRWIAYAAGAPGARQVWVRPYPGVEKDRWRISVGGGTSPRWSPDGRTIYYLNGGSMMAVGLRPGAPFSHDEPVRLFEGNYLPDFDVARDGRFLMIRRPAEQPSSDNRIVVVLNWFADLKARFK